MMTPMFTGMDALIFILCGALLVIPFAVKFGIEIGRLRERDANAKFLRKYLTATKQDAQD